MRGTDMSAASRETQDASVLGYLLRAVGVGAVGALAGVALGLGTALTGNVAGAAVGAAIGFALTSGVYLVTAHRAIHRLRTQVEEMETRDPLTGLRNLRALRTWLEHYLPRANEVQSHTARDRAAELRELPPLHPRRGHRPDQREPRSRDR